MADLKISSVFHGPLRTDPENAVQDPPSRIPRQDRGTLHMQTMWWKKETNSNITNESNQQIITYIFIKLGETWAEVEDRCQVSTYIASDFHWFRGSWTLAKMRKKRRKGINTIQIWFMNTSITCTCTHTDMHITLHTIHLPGCLKLNYCLWWVWVKPGELT